MPHKRGIKMNLNIKVLNQEVSTVMLNVISKQKTKTKISTPV